MRPNGALGPNETKDGDVYVQAVHLAHRGRSRHSILPVRIVQKMMQRLLVLPKRTRELEACRLRQPEAWRALVPQGGFTTHAYGARHVLRRAENLIR